MKIKHLFLGIVCATMTMSCTDYLDVSPDSGLTEEEIFSSYGNTVKFFNTVYNGDKTELEPKVYNLDIVSSFPLESTNCARVFGLKQTVDIYDVGKIEAALTYFKKGSWGGNAWFTSRYDDASTNNFRPIFRGMFNVIRTCNRVLMNLDKIEDANSQRDIEDIRGQAYFIRAYAHFVLGTIWGPFPYITDIMTAENYDRPRLSAVDYFKEIANDCDRARETFEAAGLMRRDPGPGQAGHLQDANQDKPTGVAALALKSRALLYRASPLSNPDENQQLWIEAADAAAEALTVAEQYQYELQPWENYYDNFYGQNYTNEHLWARAIGPVTWTGYAVRLILGTTLTGQQASWGLFPTQSLVDMYDTKWGDQLVTEEDRRKAEESFHYDDMDPYANREPRFYGNIFFNQADITWSAVNAGEEPNKFNCYYTNEGGKQVYSTFAQGYAGLIGDTKTGYVARKYTGDWHYGRQTPRPKLYDTLFRLAELYLNYAEAANEAYGPQGKSPQGTMTALEAMNVIRRRVSEDLVLDKNDPTVSNKDAFRERIQKERTIEFDQENDHRYFDIRRWKIAPKVMSAPVEGVMIQQVSNNTALPYKERFVHTRYTLPATSQSVWKDEMYFWPFEKDDYYRYEIFDTSLNPYW